MSLSILLVDDDVESLQSTKKILEFSNYSVTTASSGEEALKVLSERAHGLVITDVRMPGMSGIEFVENYQKRGLQIPFIVMTAFGDVKDAVWAMKLGAVDFLLKPFKRQGLLDAIHQIESRVQTKSNKKVATTQNLFVGNSPEMKELNVLIAQVAQTDASVLVLGESGVGKEQVARLIHSKSKNANGPFIAVNCAAIPENLIESELFGHEKGAFSGASHSKPGLLEFANGGTVLLDEIGDMPMTLQPKLLRFLEDQKIRRLGSTQEKTVQVRVLAATHQNLLKLVKEQKFRQDLFYRLDVMTLQVPALRERKLDIPELAQYFISRFSVEQGKVISGIDSEVLEALLAHSWPGNVRELSNVLERGVVLNQTGTFNLSDLPQHLITKDVEAIIADQVTIPLGMSLREVEDLMIKKALDATQGDRASAAKLLGVNERTIYRRITKSKEE